MLHRLGGCPGVRAGDVDRARALSRGRALRTHAQTPGIALAEALQLG